MSYRSSAVAERRPPLTAPSDGPHLRKSGSRGRRHCHDRRMRARCRALGGGIIDRMEVRPGLSVAEDAVAAFARRHGIGRLALYGSVLREDFTAGSDIDVLVEFLPDRTPGLLGVAEMELELEVLLGREVEMRTYHDLSRHFRDRVLAESVALYAA